MFVLTAGGLLARGQCRLVALGRGTRGECEAMQERFARLGLLRLNKAYGLSEGGGDAAINPQLTSYGNGLDSVARLIARLRRDARQTTSRSTVCLREVPVALLPSRRNLKRTDRYGEARVETVSIYRAGSHE
jgi:hypothetical protein